MRRSPLNPKPIKLSHYEACVFLGNALREYFKNETRDEETKEDGSSTEESISGPIKLVGGYRRRSRFNEVDTTISTAA